MSGTPHTRPDRTGNRSVIDDAAVQLIADEGLEAATVRKVAARAGVSPGMVQHHYPTKQALLLAAMARVEASVQQRVQTVAEDQPAAAQLHALALEILPLDATRAAEARVWLAFAAKAAVDPVIAAAHATSWQQLENAIAHLLAAHAGENKFDPPVADRAAILLAGLDGLAATAVNEPRRLSPARIETLANHMLHQALTVTLRSGRLAPVGGVLAAMAGRAAAAPTDGEGSSDPTMTGGCP